ncbi:phosphotransferase [Nocardiopsis sp. NPDC058631]|uniref:phosphotransferase n=1 Tax=Nocardiopsis sp. NPDC058631 TaxID=3346566 RepID=UPI00366175D2
MSRTVVHEPTLPGPAPLVDDIGAVLRNARAIPFHPRVFRVEHEGRHLVVKRARGHAAGAESLLRERLANELAASARTPDGAALCSAPVWHDDAHLVFEAGAEDTTLQDALAREGDTSSARLCGVLTATLHGLDPAGLAPAAPERPRLFPLGPDEYATTSDQVIAMLRALDRHPGARRALESVAEAGQDGTVFVHGDLKPDNILVRPGAGLTLIDWELAGRGDPHEDLAAFLAGVLASSLHHRILNARAEDPGEVRAAVTAAAEETFAYFALMLDGYREVRGLEPDLERLLLLTGSRLFCRAQSLATIGSQVGTVPVVLQHAVVGMLGDLPAAAARLRAVLDEGGAA